MHKSKTYPTNKKIQLAGIVVEKAGKLKGRLFSPEMLDHFYQTHCHEGDHISIEVKNRRPKRSVAQNSFYHVYLSLIEFSSGFTMNELKAWVREHILGKGITEVFGDKTRVVGSSADLNISEFVEMMNTIHERTDIPVPDPTAFGLPMTLDEYGKLKDKQKETYKAMKPKIKKNA